MLYSFRRLRPLPVLARALLATFAGASLLMLGACQAPHELRKPSADPVSPNEAYSLTLLHVNDHHSHLDESFVTLRFDTGKPEPESVRLPVGGFARVATAMRELALSRADQTIKIHAGDAITGDLYYTLTDGQADADLMNVVCFDSLTLGNHEFDHGDTALKRFIERLHNHPCRTPVLSANVRFGSGSALHPSTAPAYVQPSTVLERNGRRIGLVGITVAHKTSNASRPDPGTVFLDEAKAAQAEIDVLKQQGVDIIVLQTHHGYQADKHLASKLRGVNAIIGGDSHTLLGPDHLRHYGLNPQGPYPTRTVDADGKLVCIAQAGHYAYIVGELNLHFDGNGRLLSCHGTPHILVGNNFEPARRNQTPFNQLQLQAIAADLSHSNVQRPTHEDPLAQAALLPHRTHKLAFGASVVAQAHETLCARRTPLPYSGQGSANRDSTCSSQTRLDAHGGDIQQLVAHAYLLQARNYFEADLALINAGGVRTDIPAGPVTVKDIYNLLPFKNTLVQLKIPGALLKEALESAIDAALAPQPSSGAFPYVAGMRWVLNIDNPKGARLTQLEVDRGNGQFIPFDPAQIYAIATIDFIADGKDHYQPFEQLQKQQRLDAGLDATELFLAYVKEASQADKGLRRLPAQLYSTQKLILPDEPEGSAPSSE